MKRYALLLSSAAFLLLTLPLSAARNEQHSALYVFGDSLVDIGNVFISSQQLGFNPPVPPSVSPHQTYFQGRFSNGPVAFELLWQMLEHRKPGKKKALAPSVLNPCENGVEIGNAVDFGFGGSGTGVSNLTPGGFAVPGLLSQVASFACALHDQAPPVDALYAIWSGANDYFNYLSPAPLDPLLTPAQVVGNIVVSIQGLYALGARQIVVLTQPNLGSIPLVLGTPGSALLTTLSQQHNVALTAALSQLAGLPGLQLVRVDVNTALSHLPNGANVVFPALDALFPPPGVGEIPMSRCLILAPSECRDVPTFDVGLQYAFWDAQHPTTAVHRLIAEEIYATLVE